MSLIAHATSFTATTKNGNGLQEIRITDNPWFLFGMERVRIWTRTGKHGIWETIFGKLVTNKNTLLDLDFLFIEMTR